MLDKKELKIGDSLSITFDLKNTEEKRKKVRLEYAVDFVKASGRTSRKVFQIIETEYKSGLSSIKRKHSFMNLTTRKHYPGLHRFFIVVNGHLKAETSVILKK